jgi:hypothetical protein
MMKYAVAMPELIGQLLRAHLARGDSQEDLCFAVWKPSRGHTRMTALIADVILPEPGDHAVHGNASFHAQYVERAVGAALERGGGIAFLHSHPAHGWQGMSNDDIRAETLLAPTALGATGLPLVGLTLAARDGTWSARVWEKVGPKKYERRWAESVRQVGERLVVHFADKLLPPPAHRETQVRTVASWGPEAQARIARLRVGVAGLGSVGSIVAEALARTGIQNVTLMDYQALEAVNLDRTLNASPANVGSPKVVVAAEALRKSATAKPFYIDPHIGSVCEEAGYRKALDCDVIFSCVDRPWGRSVLNYVAYSHLIPVIDGGLLVSRTKKGLLRSADWKAHVVGPSHRCLLCLGQYDPAFVEADRRGDLEDPKYLESLPTDHPARANENVFGFSLAVASLEVLQFLMIAVGPSGLGSPGPQNYHMLTGTADIGLMSCEPDCVFPELIAAGESETPGTGVHAPAEAARAIFASQSKPVATTNWTGRLKRALGLG